MKRWFDFARRSQPKCVFADTRAYDDPLCVFRRSLLDAPRELPAEPKRVRNIAKILDAREAQRARCPRKLFSVEGHTDITLAVVVVEDPLNNLPVFAHDASTCLRDERGKASRVLLAGPTQDHHFFAEFTPGGRGESSPKQIDTDNFVSNTLCDLREKLTCADQDS